MLNRDTGGRPFDDVLIIGAGSGNDVAAALWHGAGAVDAVEIDPSIQRIGRIDHPNRPYADRRVTAHLDDGRSFVKATGRKYDLATYALVDSLVLHSGYSSLRLESFLFTEEAFRDVKAKLKPGGAFVMYNAYRQGWVVGRLAALAEKVFGTKPIVLSMPHVDAIEPGDNQGGRVTCLIVGMPGSPFVERVGKAFDAGRSFWLASVPTANARPTVSVTRPPRGVGYDGAWSEVRPVRVATSGVGPLPTDAWPFLYLREPVIPALNLRGMALVAGISLVILASFAGVRTARPSGRMFFLGAGFMLLESKGVVHMALLFGSTWVVNAVVFGAILVMILLSNLFVSVGAAAGTVAVLLASRCGAGGQRLGADVRVPASGGPVAADRLVRGGLHTGIFRRGDLRGRVPRQSSSGRRPRLKCRRRDPRRAGREPVAGARLRPPLAGRPRFLFPVSLVRHSLAGLDAAKSAEFTKLIPHSPVPS